MQTPESAGELSAKAAAYLKYVEWRYIAGGNVRHAIVPGLYTSTSEAACGLYVVPASSWLGTGSQEEYERAEGLRPCRSCLAAIERHQEGYA
jgi:hypothetical protein